MDVAKNTFEATRTGSAHRLEQQMVGFLSLRRPDGGPYAYSGFRVPEEVIADDIGASGDPPSQKEQVYAWAQEMRVRHAFQVYYDSEDGTYVFGRRPGDSPYRREIDFCEDPPTPGIVAVGKQSDP